MQLTLAVHPITDIQFGTRLSLDGSALTVDGEEMRRLVLEDAAIDSVDFDIVRPGESCRAGPIFDVVEPRAKEPTAAADFPGIIGAPTTAGIGTTHVLSRRGGFGPGGDEAGPDPQRHRAGVGNDRSRHRRQPLFNTLVISWCYRRRSRACRAGDVKSLPYRQRQSRRSSRPSRARPHAAVRCRLSIPSAPMEPGREGLTAGRLYRPDFFAPAQTGGRRADYLWDQYRRHAAGNSPSRRMARRRAGAVAQFLVRRHRDLFLSESSGGSRTLPAPSRARDKFRRHGGDRRRQRQLRPRSVNATPRQIWPNGTCAPTAPC